LLQLVEHHTIMTTYFKLFRWSNLLVIALTQVLLRYTIIEPLLQQNGYSLALSDIDFVLLVLATLFISAAGYAINDYFDLRTDRINKPQKTILGKSVSRRAAIFYHSLFNIVAVIIGLYLSLKLGEWNLVFIFIAVPTLLWMYSVRYKRKIFIGNAIIALLSAFVIAIVWIFEYHAVSKLHQPSQEVLQCISFYTRIYGAFAFLTTLIREIVKDIEDIKGDSKIGCKTIPILWGIKATKKLVVFLCIILFVFIAGFQYHMSRYGFDLIIAYMLLMVQIPLIIFINKTITAREKTDYGALSSLAKGIMVMGIISMVLFYFYFQQGILPE
jgi:4-hydroxybenzoate polyprenyltransferase